MAQFVAALSTVGKLATIGSAKWACTGYRVYGTASRRFDQRDVSPDGMEWLASMTELESNVKQQVSIGGKPSRNTGKRSCSYCIMFCMTSSKNLCAAKATSICISHYPRPKNKRTMQQDAATAIKRAWYGPILKFWFLQSGHVTKHAKKWSYVGRKHTVWYIEWLGAWYSGTSGTLRCPHASRFAASKI